ncbi:MAG: 16S rRNA (adenine(1518)-N(6)/adenine(1519)-N(6))-dimethyltransferase RsmA [Woeseiaceae bacterium]
MSKHRPRKRFGQHFLRDPGVTAAIVDAISPTGTDTVVEIGPGPGAITAPIAKIAHQTHLVELDRDLAAQLRTQYSANDRVTVHEADALRFDFTSLGGELRIVGNLPYNISTPLLFYLLEQRQCIRDMHFMLQKEVVDRMAASPGSKAYGRLGIMLQCWFEIDALFDVDRAAFEPPPDVTSAVVRLTPKPDSEVAIDDPVLLSTVVAAAFSRRRKTLRNALAGKLDTDDFDALDIDPSLRPENIAFGDWVRIANYLAQAAR